MGGYYVRRSQIEPRTYNTHTNKTVLEEGPRGCAAVYIACIICCPGADARARAPSQLINTATALFRFDYMQYEREREREDRELNIC